MKKNFVLLKQCALALTLLISSAIILHSCKKDSQSQPKITALDLQEVKNWVKSKLKTTENNPFKTMNPNWDNLYTNIVDNQTIIEVGLNNPDKIFVGDSPNDATESNLGLSKCNIRLVLFKNADNNTIVSGCYMAVVNNAQFKKSEIHYKNVGDLTGKLYYFNTDGSFSNGSLYSNGQIAKHTANLNLLNESLKNIKLPRSGIKKLSGSMKDEIIAVKSPCADGIEIPIWGQSCVGAEGYEVCSPYISGFAHLPGSCDGDYGENEGYAGTHGGYSGGGSNGTANKEIIDSLRGYPCAQALIKEIKTNVCTDIATLIKNTFAKDDLVDIKFTADKSLVGTDTDGHESEGNSSRLTAEFTVGLNPDVLNKSTQEYVLVTMYHEALHAFFDRRLQVLGETEFKKRYEGVSVSGGRLLGVVDNDHLPLAYQNYVKGLKDVIMKFNTSFSEDRAWVLAKGGIIQFLPDESKINNQERDATKPGYTGTKCP